MHCNYIEINVVSYYDYLGKVCWLQINVVSTYVLIIIFSADMTQSL